ncbi:MAG: hypothetical protein QG551_427 [Patescibacteria group bacterium]|jgi:ABC-type uncharacterized transport system fused permease/ATPase subunit|nr:hypothetical protein [Patescibacteria group bacterium]
MHDNKSDNKVTPESKLVSERSDNMSMLLQKVIGTDSFNPTEQQVDEVLSQRRQVLSYVHEDRKQESTDKKFYFTLTLVATTVIILLVLFFAKEYLTQVLSLIIGGLGGYGIGKTQKDQ